MKLLTLVVHTNVQQDLTTVLRNLDPVSGFTFSHVEGHGIEVDKDPFLSARDNTVGFVPRIRADILLEDADVDAVLTVLGDKEHNITGQGVYWVTPVEKGGHLL